VVGDEGIHERVGDPHWHLVRDLMADRLRANAPREAIERGVEALGRHSPSIIRAGPTTRTS
jgi:uncharacterized membrane protein